MKPVKHKDRIKVLFMSDIHLFHRKTPTSKIVEELKSVFTPQLKNIDIVFFGGDVFDRINSIPDENVAEALGFIHHMVWWCLVTDTQLRILEGTPSHDWKQSNLFLLLNRDADIEYYPTLSIEYNSKYDINVLYVPDEWNPSTEETYRQVKKLMEDRALSQVDLSIMHGQFQYQLPHVAKAPKHIEDDYLSITKYYISIGHVHRHSTFDRILAQGSFSRLCHGEEENKGYIIADLFLDGSMKYKFIINKEATDYITIPVDNLTVDNWSEYIHREIHHLKQGSHVRLQGTGDHFLIKGHKEIYDLYPQFNWSLKIQTLEKDRPAEQTLKTEVKRTVIHKENIEDVLKSYMQSKGTESDMVIKSMVLLREMMERVG